VNPIFFLCPTVGMLARHEQITQAIIEMHRIKSVRSPRAFNINYAVFYHVMMCAAGNLLKASIS
jgi:hypothetical protein